MEVPLSLLPDDFDAIPRKAPLFWDVVRLFDPEAPPWDDLDPTFQKALDHAVAEIVPSRDATREAEDLRRRAEDALDDVVAERDDLFKTVTTLEHEIAQLRRQQ